MAQTIHCDCTSLSRNSFKVIVFTISLSLLLIIKEKRPKKLCPVTGNTSASSFTVNLVFINVFLIKHQDTCVASFEYTEESNWMDNGPYMTFKTCLIRGKDMNIVHQLAQSIVYSAHVHLSFNLSTTCECQNASVFSFGGLGVHQVCIFVKGCLGCCNTDFLCIGENCDAIRQYYNNSEWFKYFINRIRFYLAWLKVHCSDFLFAS